MKILLAVDGSKNSLDAVASLIRHADWFREAPKVQLVYVHLPVPKVGLFGAGPSKAALDKYYNDEGAQCLAKATRLLDKARIPHTDSILVGDPAETICKTATQAKCDLICMGSRGLGATANLVLGSVATKVLHSAKVPVLLVK
jgi:nucleotide-binding universal stress UspA family protein